MNKTGIAITVTSNGMGHPIVANPGDWTRHITDLRHILGRVTPPCDNQSHPLIYMTFSASGTYIAVARTISGRLGDNVAAWLYIPDRIDIRGEEVAVIIDRLGQLINAGRLPDEAELSEEFAECYAPAAMHTAAFSSDPEGSLAWRRIGVDELEELAGTFRRRPYYAEYCGVILAHEGQTVAGAVDLTEYPLDDIDAADDEDISSEITVPKPQLVPPVPPHPAGHRLCRQWQPYALGALGGFILGLLAAYIIGYCDSHNFRLHAAWPPIEAVPITETPAGGAPSDTIPTDTVTSSAGFTAVQIAEAVTYLDTCKVWNKADMDSMPPIAGLWDALNECRYDDVAGYAIRLDGSDALKAIADTLKAFTPNVLYGIPLNISGDTAITPETYGSLLRATAKKHKQ